MAAMLPNWTWWLRCLSVLFWSLRINAYSALSDETLRMIPGAGDDFDIHEGALLAPILIPRVSGTPGNLQVLEHLADFFRTQLPQWDISFQNSTATTPATGSRQIPFNNLIVTRSPPWASVGETSFLTLAAHFDSKLTPTGFIGATDSAAPCAMLMQVARAVDAALEQKWAGMDATASLSQDEQGVQILFLDGEEAFLTWSATDSIYGARSLAAEWEQTPHPALSTYHDPLAAIELFVLLDLLGAKDPTVPSYFKTTHWAYIRMAALEKRLRGLGLFQSTPSRSTAMAGEAQFLPESDKSDADQWMGGFIGDDHEPFLQRGVDVLHLITTPFPRVWHHMDDTGANLDLPTMHDWTRLVSAFVAEWMELEGFFRPNANANVNANAGVGTGFGSAAGPHVRRDAAQSEL